MLSGKSLRRQHDREVEPHLVFYGDRAAGDTNRRYPESRLANRGRSREVLVVDFDHLHGDRMRLPVQRELPLDLGTARVRDRSRLRGEMDRRITRDVEDLRTDHIGLY